MSNSFFDTTTGKVCFWGVCGFGIFSACSISGGQITLGIALIALLKALYDHQVTPIFTTMEPPFVLFAFCGLCSLANAVDVSRGIMEMKKFLILIPFFIPYWLPFSPEQRKTILALTISSGAIVTIFQLAFFLRDLSLEIHRFEGPFSLSLTFGENQALCFCLALIWLLNHEAEDPVPRTLLIAIVILLAIGVLFSLARGAWVASVLGLFFIFRKQWKAVAASILLVSVLLIGFLVISPSAGSRFFLVRTDDWLRFRIWHVGSQILSRKPVFGVGMNNVKPLYAEYATPEEAAKGRIFGHQHSNFLQYLLMTGFLGFVAFWWWLVEMAFFCAKSSERILDNWQKSLAANSPALFLIFWGFGFTEYSFGDEEVAMLFFFLLGLICSPSPKPWQEKIYESPAIQAS